MQVKSSDRRLSRTTPLCYLPSGRLICYRYGKILVLNGKIVERTVQLNTLKKETILARSRLAFRLFRLGIRTAIAIDESHILLSMGNSLFEFDLSSGNLSSGYYCGKGIRPLVFSHVENITGIESGIYFGSYQSVNSSNSVQVFKRIGQDRWRIVYTFEHGSVEHVHNIIPDPYRNCLWILTGDFGDNAAMWRVTNNFSKVERVFFGSQRFRACVAYAIPEGILYATDSPLDENYILLLDPGMGVLKELSSIKGSCIYGCQWKDRYVFESTVEPSGIYKNKLEELFSMSIGPGINDRFVRIYCGNLQTGFHEIYKEKKDYLPFVSFQFGAVRFPNGINESERLWFQPVSTVRNDLRLMYIDDFVHSNKTDNGNKA